MGYTHYWEFKKVKKASELEKSYQLAVRDCARIIKAWYRENGGLSGYTAHTKLGHYGGIELNGKSDNGHETFSLREHFSQNDSFAFCKTARKPYDTVVTACLAVLQHRLGQACIVSSDGDASDWENGVEYARKVTKLKLKNPFDTGNPKLKLVG